MRFYIFTEEGKVSHDDVEGFNETPVGLYITEGGLITMYPWARIKYFIMDPEVQPNE